MPVAVPTEATAAQAQFQGYDAQDVLRLIDSLPPHILEPHQNHPRGLGTFCRRDPANDHILVWISPGGANREVVNMVLFEGWRIVLCVPVDSWDAKSLTAEDVRRAAKDFVHWELLGTEFGAVMVQPAIVLENPGKGSEKTGRRSKDGNAKHQPRSKSNHTPAGSHPRKSTATTTKMSSSSSSESPSPRSESKKRSWRALFSPRTKTYRSDG